MKNIKKSIFFQNNIRISLALFLFAVTLVLSLLMFLLQKKTVMIKTTISLSEEYKSFYKIYPFFLDQPLPEHVNWINFIIEKIINKFNDEGYTFFDSRLAYFPDNFINEGNIFSIEKFSSNNSDSFNLIFYVKKENSYQNFYLVKNRIRNMVIDIVRKNPPQDILNGIIDNLRFNSQIVDNTNLQNNEKKNLSEDELKLKYFEFLINELKKREVTDKFPLVLTDNLIEQKWNSYFYYFAYCLHSSVLIYIFFFLLKNKKK